MCRNCERTCCRSDKVPLHRSVLRSPLVQVSFAIAALRTSDALAPVLPVLKRAVEQLRSCAVAQLRSCPYIRTTLIPRVQSSEATHVRLDGWLQRMMRLSQRLAQVACTGRLRRSLAQVGQRMVQRMLALVYKRVRAKLQRSTSGQYVHSYTTMNDPTQTPRLPLSASFSQLPQCLPFAAGSDPERKETERKESGLLTPLLTGSTTSSMDVNNDKAAIAASVSVIHVKKCIGASILVFSIEPTYGVPLILLAREKKRRWTGNANFLYTDFGGCSDHGETPEQTAAREFVEESLGSVKYFGDPELDAPDVMQRNIAESLVCGRYCARLETPVSAHKVYVTFVKQVAFQPAVCSAFRRAKDAIFAARPSYHFDSSNPRGLNGRSGREEPAHCTARATSATALVRSTTTMLDAPVCSGADLHICMGSLKTDDAEPKDVEPEPEDAEPEPVESTTAPDASDLLASSFFSFFIKNVASSRVFCSCIKSAINNYF